jgi:hypothetical protein
VIISIFQAKKYVYLRLLLGKECPSTKAVGSEGGNWGRVEKRGEVRVG